MEHFDDEQTLFDEVFNLPDVFKIFLRSTATCQGCSRISEESFYLWLLTLHFPLGLDDEALQPTELDIYSLMDTYFKLEMLTEHICSQCGLLGGTGKMIAMINVPQVLLLHISRFDSGLHKIHHYVRFPQHLTTDNCLID